MSGPTTYRDAGVVGQQGALAAVARHLGPTLDYPAGATVLTGFGHYAAVVQLSTDMALAITTDGVGTKTIVASMMDRYDTIGFDCVAMNANDVVCVGARPVAMVDYLGVHALDERRIEAMVAGLGAAAAQAGIAIPGGELAQLPEIIGAPAGGGDERAFDLVGTCVGIVRPDQVILGDAVAPGDALVGITSSGIHSNGLTLARRALLDDGGLDLDHLVPELGRSLGEELLEPTAIYVRSVLDLWAHGIETHGLAHISGDGLANLLRLNAGVGYSIDALPAAPAIFELVRRTGDVALEEMFRVFNMGVGFVVAVAQADAGAAVEIIARSGHRAQPIGSVTEERGRVRIEPAGVTLT